MPARNRNLDFRVAQQRKRDEFYTSRQDIELELVHYESQLANKVVYCNCDDPHESEFFRYFVDNFARLGLKKLIATSYRSEDATHFSKYDSKHAVSVEYSGEPILDHNQQLKGLVRPLTGDGDFRSEESRELLAQADVVVTNPPFSLFRDYVSQLVEHGKQFIILGNINAATYGSIFPLFESGKVWLGASIHSGDREFRVPSTYPLEGNGCRIDEAGNRYIRVKGVRWFTNLDYPQRHRDLHLVESYRPDHYPKYANFDAIDVGRTARIPVDYPGLMGVPISFLDKHNPDQFEIVGSSHTLGTPMSEIAPKGSFRSGGPRFYLPNGDGTYRRLYDRIVIRNRRLS